MCLAPNTTIKSNSLPLAFSVSRYYLHTFYVRYDQHHSKCSFFSCVSAREHGTYVQPNSKETTKKKKKAAPRHRIQWPESFSQVHHLLQFCCMQKPLFPSYGTGICQPAIHYYIPTKNNVCCIYRIYMRINLSNFPRTGQINVFPPGVWVDFKS